MTEIEVTATRPRANRLIFSYALRGQMSGIRIPSLTMPAQKDDLWRRTCFEAFVRTSPGTAYYEFNFSPSTEWAAYRFTDYRSGMRPAKEITVLSIDVLSTAEAYGLQAVVELSEGAASDIATWRLALSAVIEEASGDKSYWALAHPPGKPDFHHADGFVQELSVLVGP